MRPSCFAGQLWPPSAAPSQGGAGGGQRCQIGQRSRSLAVMWRGSGRESCMLQLSDLLVFWQYEIDLRMQRDRRSISAPTCQDGCQVKRLYHGQSVTVIWVTHIHRWWTRRVEGGRTKNDCFSLCFT